MKVFDDMYGTPLEVGDAVVMVDNSGLEDKIPVNGQILMVTSLVDADSNYIKFGKYECFGYRVLKLVTR